MKYRCEECGKEFAHNEQHTYLDCMDYKEQVKIDYTQWRNYE